MNRTTRAIAGITLIVLTGVFAAPLQAVESESPTTEETICEAVDPLRDVLATAVQAGNSSVTAREDAVSNAANALDDSSTALGTTALAYLRALDGTGNERTTLTAVQNAAALFTTDVVAFIDSVDDLEAGLLDLGINKAVLRYYIGLCPAPTPSPSPTPSVSPTPSPTPPPGGLGGLLSNLLGGLFGQP